MPASRIATRAAALTATLGLGAALLVGCSSTLSQTDVQDKLAAGLSEQYGGSYAVTCPSDLTPQAGGTFTCDATNSADGSSVTINVSQDDDQGNLSWTATPTDAAKGGGGGYSNTGGG